MRGLALEYVVKWIILLVVALVLINLVIYFSDEIKTFLTNWMEKERPKAEVVEASKFSTAQLITYIKACWDKTGETFKTDVVCFVLKGDVNGVDKNLLLGAVDYPASVDVSGFDTSKKMTLIRFVWGVKKIVVES